MAAAAPVDFETFKKLAEMYESQLTKKYESEKYQDYKTKLEVLIKAFLVTHKGQQWIDRSFVHGQIKHYLRDFGTIIAKSSGDQKAAEDLRTAYDLLKSSTQDLLKTKKAFQEAVSQQKITPNSDEFRNLSPTIQRKIIKLNQH